LRLVFTRWGLPKRLRVDNGHPWGATGGLPTGLSLWLAGLGVELVCNRPRRPEDNGVVERSQGTTKRWAEPASCKSVEELQRAVDREDHVQREVFPALDRRSRREAFPGLLHSGRGYGPGWETVCWSLERALTWLANFAVRRKVSKDGKVSLYDRRHSVGQAFAGQEVVVCLSVETLEWVVATPEGTELRRLPAPQLSQENIVNLRVSRQRNRAPDAQP
jgi:hypothetical protein